MNPVFIILVFLAAAALWFLSSPLFRPLGRLISKIWQDAVDEINKDEDGEKEDEQ